MKDVGYGLLYVAFILLITISFRGIYAMLKAANNRKPGVSYYTAMSGFSIFFRRSLYTDEGMKWCLTYTKCWLSFFAIVLSMLAISAFTGDLK